MNSSAIGTPSAAIEGDAANDKAPDPRRHYRSPEELVEDVNLDLAQREELLREWKADLQARLEAESEGMSASDPISPDNESRLSSEARRVNDALASVTKDRDLSGDKPG
jgi:hypothetical protein